MPIKEIIIGKDKDDSPEELLAGRDHEQVFSSPGDHFRSTAGAKNHLRTWNEDGPNDDGQDYFAVIVPAPMWGPKAVHVHWAKAK